MTTTPETDDVAARLAELLALAEQEADDNRYYSGGRSLAHHSAVAEYMLANGTSLLSDRATDRATIASLTTRVAELEGERDRLLEQAKPNMWWHPDWSEKAIYDPCEHNIEQGEYGHVTEIWQGRTISSCFIAVLPPADDADSDDEWTVIADTAEEAQAALDAENARRQALAGEAG